MRRRSRSIRTAILALATLLTVVADRCADAADPLPYTTTIAPTGDAPLDQGLTDSSTLISLHDAGPIGPFGLVARARADAARFAQVLGSFGYYKAHIVITIAGKSLDDPDLPN